MFVNISLTYLTLSSMQLLEPSPQPYYNGVRNPTFWEILPPRIEAGALLPLPEF